MKTKKTAKTTLALALVLCIVSMVCASLVQTGGGKITVKDLRWETPSGHMMSALLFVPPNATADNPAPGIVTSHGWYNNREMQDLNYVEYARRGYVVMSIDMYGHGNSDTVASTEWPNRGTGMYDAVELMADLPYVDTGKIGITGHSNGARAANWSIDEDNTKENPLVSAVLLVANDATYKDPDTQEYWNKYGNRDVGIIAAQFDEFFFRVTREDGTRTKPKDYIHQETAQSFLNFGIDPAQGETRTNYTFYRQNIDGKDAVRIIYTPYQIHPWNHFSKECVVNALDFFEEAFGAPIPIASGNQVWQWKVFFNFIGLVGMVMFMVSLTKTLLSTAAFADLKAVKAPVPATAPTGKGLLWFWGGLVLCSAFGALTFFPIYRWCSANRPAFFVQSPVFFIGTWSLVCGIFALLVLVLSYQLNGKKAGMDLKKSGVAIGGKKLLKSIGLALVVVAATYGLVFLADYLFKVDFRIWVIAFKAFTPDKFGIALLYLPFFLVYYIINSVAINCFNYVRIGKKDWMNTAVLALFNGIGPLVIVAIQYIHFFAVGDMFFTAGIAGIWMIPIVVILPAAAIISRKIYRATANPYIAGIIMALMVTLMSVTNTLTQF